MQFNMLEAKTNLSSLVDSAERGEEVIIARNGDPVVKLVPIRKNQFPLGFLAGKKVADEMLMAMSDQEADAWMEGKF